MGEPPARRDLLLIDAIAIARRDPKVAEAYRRVIQAHVGAFERTTKLGVDSGRIEPVLPADELARLVLALAFGVMALRSLEATPPAEATVARLTEQLLRPARERGKSGERALGRVQARAPRRGARRGGARVADPRRPRRRVTACAGSATPRDCRTSGSAGFWASAAPARQPLEGAAGLSENVTHT